MLQNLQNGLFLFVNWPVWHSSPAWQMESTLDYGQKVKPDMLFIFCHLKILMNVMRMHMVSAARDVPIQREVTSVPVKKGMAWMVMKRHVGQ